MPTEIAIKPRASEISPRSPSSVAVAKKTIAADLSYLATARQAQVDPVVLGVYYEALKDFPLDEIATACKDLARSTRREGETAMPDLGTILEAVRYAGRFRAAREVQREREREDRHLAEHPEEYVAVRDIFAMFIEKNKEKFPQLAAKNPEPAARCPHCEGALDLSAADLRAIHQSNFTTNEKGKTWTSTQ